MKKISCLVLAGQFFCSFGQNLSKELSLIGAGMTISTILYAVQTNLIIWFEIIEKFRCFGQKLYNFLVFHVIFSVFFLRYNLWEEVYDWIELPLIGTGMIINTILMYLDLIEFIWDYSDYY